MTFAGETVGFTLTPAEFRIEMQAEDREELLDLRFWNFNAGDFARIPHADGSWTAVDLSNSNNTIQLFPPEGLEPFLVPTTYVIADYTEDPPYDGAHKATVTFTLVRSEPRDPEDPTQVLTETPTADEFAFSFKWGTIATSAVEATQELAQGAYSIRAILTLEQAEVIAEEPTRTDATSVEEIPDGDDFGRDNNPEDRNTVTITPPSNLPVEVFNTPGDYVVTEWRLTMTETFGRYALDMDVYPLLGTV